MPTINDVVIEQLGFFNESIVQAIVQAMGNENKLKFKTMKNYRLPEDDGDSKPVSPPPIK